MVLRPGPASLSLLLLCACPGDPLEADSGTATGSSSGADASATMTGEATLTATAGMSATIASDSNDSSGSVTDASATSATTNDTQTSDPSETDATTTDATTDTTTTDATTTDATTETTASEESTTTSDECVGDEAMLHQDPFSAIDLGTLDCDDAAGVGAGVIDDATWEDWWWFQGNDVSECEPDAVTIELTTGSPMLVCAYVQPGCAATCAVGMSDAGGLGCCGTDQVQFSVACAAATDSTPVAIRFGDGTEQCVPITFSYEF